MLIGNYKNFIISTVTQTNSGVVNIVTIKYSKKKNYSKKVTGFCCWTAESDKKDEEQNCP